MNININSVKCSAQQNLDGLSTKHVSHNPTSAVKLTATHSHNMHLLSINTHQFIMQRFKRRSRTAKQQSPTCVKQSKAMDMHAYNHDKSVPVLGYSVIFK